MKSTLMDPRERVRVGQYYGDASADDDERVEEGN